MSTRFVHVLAAFLAFFFLATLGVQARADSKVDWSQFIEKPGDRPVVNKPAMAQAPTKNAAKPAKAAKPAAKRAAKSSKKKH